MDPADHRAVAARFTAVVEGVQDWDAPAPVEGWTARDVVGHLVEWFPAFLAGGTSRSWTPGPPVGEDPVGAWRAQVEGIQALLEDPSSATETFAHPMVPEMPLERAVGQFYTADVFMHTWDLARASGQDARLDPDACAQLLAGMQPIEELLRSSGQYGPAHPVAEDADVQDRLVAFIGRDPDWHPPIGRP